MIRCLFTNTGFGITANGNDDDLIQTQRFRGGYNIGSGEVIEVHPLLFSASQSADTTPDDDEFIEGFGYVMLGSTVNSGGEEILEDDDGYRVYNDGCSMAEALGGADFEFI